MDANRRNVPFVIAAKAGIHLDPGHPALKWIPAFAGMMMKGMTAEGTRRVR
jgi:hypothetical protein